MLDVFARPRAPSPTDLRAAVETAGLGREGWCERRDTVPEPPADIGAALAQCASARVKSRRRSRRNGPHPRHEVRQMMARSARAAGREKR